MGLWTDTISLSSFSQDCLLRVEFVMGLLLVPYSRNELGLIQINSMFIMFVCLCTLHLLQSVRASKSEDLIIFDNFDYSGVDYGSEEKMVDYALLGLDKKMDLPSSFTICSSIHRNIVSSAVFFYQLYQDDGKPWLNMYIISRRDVDKFQEKVQLMYYKPLSNI